MLRLWRRYAPPAGDIPLALPDGKLLRVPLPAPPGHLPDPGGTQQQAAVMMDAFDVMSAAEQAFRRLYGNRD
jgi:hypothetical protein